MRVGESCFPEVQERGNASGCETRRESQARDSRVKGQRLVSHRPTAHESRACDSRGVFMRAPSGLQVVPALGLELMLSAVARDERQALVGLGDVADDVHVFYR